jgi:hypothetical protein
MVSLDILFETTVSFGREEEDFSDFLYGLTEE